MRIIAGKFKGKKLKTFTLSSTRPTSDMVRESLFNKIGTMVDESIFLDLFCGTGACGIEALSRGAKQVYFVDENIDAIKLTRSNLALIKTNDAHVLNMNFSDALKKFNNQNIKFDIIFLDPPYKSDFAEMAISLIKRYDLIFEDSVIVWEHDKDKNEIIEKYFENSTTKKYGDKYLTYLDYDCLKNFNKYSI